MRISRQKKSNKTLIFFASHFNYRIPYQILIDGTFCQAALQHKVSIEEQLRKYFQTEIKLLTTQCIILEVESLGGKLVGATTIVKKFAVHKCGHEGKPVTAAECIKSMAKSSRYIIATQDRTLQQCLRKVPGRCILYLHRATPVLETPSPASKKWVQKKAKQFLPDEVNARITHMKNEQGLPVPSKVEKLPKKKRHKNPNPLSCKKKKKLQINDIQSKRQTKHHNDSDSSKLHLKPKRKRIKIPIHIKEAIKTNQLA